MFYLSCCPYWTNSAASGINPTITTPDTTIARLLMAPCSSLAFNDSAVPMAWEAAPKANPFAIGSSILKILKISPETTVPKMPAKMTPATMIPATPPISSVVSNAMAIVIERAKVDSVVISLIIRIRAKPMIVTRPLIIPAKQLIKTTQLFSRKILYCR